MFHRKTAPSLLFLSLVASGLLARGCTAPDQTPDVPQGRTQVRTSAVEPSLTLGERAHVMPLLSWGNAALVRKVPKLVYYGGPVIPNARVWTVYWGQPARFASELDTFYAQVVASSYLDWLSEYATPTQTMGRGSFAGRIVDADAPKGAVVDDAQIQTELSRLISAGVLPPNDDGNVLYMVHFPPGIAVTQGGNRSCQVFCAYHGTFKRALTPASAANPLGYHYYGVMPDQGGDCLGACGASDNELDNLTAVSSHELVEAITDAAVGFATTYGPPLAWYDTQFGEIGDICNAVQAKVGQHTVQGQWSNAKQACVVGESALACTSSCAGKACGADDGCGQACQGNDCVEPTPATDPSLQFDPSLLSTGVVGAGESQRLSVTVVAGVLTHLRLTGLDGDCDLELLDGEKVMQKSQRLGVGDEHLVFVPSESRQSLRIVGNDACAYRLERAKP